MQPLILALLLVHMFLLHLKVFFAGCWYTFKLKSKLRTVCAALAGWQLDTPLHWRS